MPAERFPLEAPTAALDSAIRQRDAPEQMRESLEQFLRQQGVEGDDLTAMLAVGAKRILVYRQLVHGRLRKTIREFIPRTAARRGDAEFRADVALFIEQCGAHSPYLRDVPAEFVEWIVPRWNEDDAVPGYLPELAQHELLSLDVRNDWRGGEPATDAPFALEKPLRFDGATRLVEYRHAVHRLPKATDDRQVPDAEPTYLLAYRDDKHNPRYLALTEFAYHVLRELLLDKTTVVAGLRNACATLGVPLDDDKLATAAQLFADLGDRGVCLGTEP